MSSDRFEYEGIIRKLLEKTRQQKVVWTTELGSNTSFRCSIGDHETKKTLIGRPNEEEKNFSFTAFLSGPSESSPALTMHDYRGNEIFEVVSNDLPTSAHEEEVSQIVSEIYELARRQALKIDEKLIWASALLDQV